GAAQQRVIFVFATAPFVTLNHGPNIGRAEIVADCSPTGRCTCQCVVRRSPVSRTGRASAQGQLAGSLQPVHPDEGPHVFLIHRWHIFVGRTTADRATFTLSSWLYTARTSLASLF